jgi:nitroimidazol reductase NimA-like FMN-containing flavoprotein (pyridoxamine 5'-phosphate oxidase superfamily)
VPKLDSAGFEVLDEEDCYELLGESNLGRVGVTLDALPHIFPVNYALVDRQVVFSTGHGTKLTAALSATVVAFEADRVDGPGGQVWSVHAIGRAILVEPGSDMEAAAKVAVHALAPLPRRFLVKIRPSHISGRRLPSR